MAGVVVFDVETQKSFQEVGGRNNFRALGISVAVAYHYDSNEYVTYWETGIEKLIKAIASSALVIGFNSRNFDYEVLAAYPGGERAREAPTLDLMEEVTKILGHRLSLESLATATLNAPKAGSGLQALDWWKKGDPESLNKLEFYCREDVRLTKELYEYGKKEGRLYYQDRKRPGEKAMVHVSW